MEYPMIERRRHQRHEAQQQPQQSAFFPDATDPMPVKPKQESPRITWQEQAKAQARRQSGRL
jgi:hypothetical protein